MKPAWFACCLGLMLWASTPGLADDYWKFKQIHGQPLEARVGRYDVDQQLLTLVTRTGQEVQVAIGELDTPDKRLLARALERSLFHKPKAAAAAASPRDNVPQDAPPGVAEPAAVAGPARPVVWHKNFQQAAAQARPTLAREAVAAEPPDSNAVVADPQRPIVWFRVLGDLRGLM